jgi:hypothetical protein
MIFRSFPVTTNPGGFLRTISGKTEKKIHDNTLKNLFFRKIRQNSVDFAANTTLFSHPGSLWRQKKQYPLTEL